VARTDPALKRKQCVKGRSIISGAVEALGVIRFGNQSSAMVSEQYSTSRISPRVYGQDPIHEYNVTGASFCSDQVPVQSVCVSVQAHKP
jgi:hypothetical protein